MRRASVAWVIQSMGGAGRAAEAFAVSPQAVYGWIRNNSLPIDRAIAVARANGIDPDLLHNPWAGTSHAPGVLSDAETAAIVRGARNKRQG